MGGIFSGNKQEVQESVTKIMSEPKQEQIQTQTKTPQQWTKEDIPKITSIFFPSKDNEKILLETICKCQKLMRICVYTITNKNIIGGLLTLIQSNQKLKIQVITDDVQTKIPSQKVQLERLLNEGKNQIQIKIDASPSSLMHNKYLIMDDEYVLTGSFNWTHKAVTTNKENLVIIQDSITTQDFISNFEGLWQSFMEFKVGMDIDQEEQLFNQNKKIQQGLDKEKLKESKKLTQTKAVKVKKEVTPRQKIEKKIKKQLEQKQKKKIHRKSKNKDSDFEPDESDSFINDDSMDSP